MTGLSTIAGLLQKLPAPARRTLYSLLMIAGAVLAAFQALGWPDWMPFSLETALTTYAALSPAAGVVAVANVSKPDEGSDDFGQDFLDDSFDEASFDPMAPDDMSFS